MTRDVTLALDSGQFEEIVSRHELTEKWLAFKRKFELTDYES